MDTGFLHTHVLFCVLYMLLLFVKFILILSKPQSRIAIFNKKTKLLHIILASGMLLTGVALVVRAPDAFSFWAITKYFVILVAIGLGILGSKRLSASFIGASVFAFVYVFFVSKTKCPMFHSTQHQIAEHLQASNPQTAIEKGKIVYQTACLRCHGKTGDAQYRNATNLINSNIPPQTVQIIVKSGKNTMPQHQYLSENDLNAVTEYVLSLRTQP